MRTTSATVGLRDGRAAYNQISGKVGARLRAILIDPSRASALLVRP